MQGVLSISLLRCVKRENLFKRNIGLTCKIGYRINDVNLVLRHTNFIYFPFLTPSIPPTQYRKLGKGYDVKERNTSTNIVLRNSISVPTGIYIFFRSTDGSSSTKRSKVQHDRGGGRGTGPRYRKSGGSNLLTLMFAPFNLKPTLCEGKMEA